MIVELMGGTIDLESEENQGSRFNIKLKMKVVKRESSNQLSSENQLKRTVTMLSHGLSSGFNNAMSRKVLVMSDIFSVRLLKGCLEPLNFSVKQIS